MSENEDTPSPQAEPLAKTRTRRSNAGARMHEMMFNAEDDEMLAQAYGIIKAEDESSDDEEYVPKEIGNDQDTAGDGDADDDDDGSDDDSSSSDSEDDDSENDDEEIDEDVGDGVDRLDEDIKDFKIGNRIKLENGATNIEPGSPSKAAYDACSRICSVCLGDQSDEDDEIIECDSCGVTVHEACYGVTGEEAPEPDNTSNHSNISSESTEPWFCEPCKRSVRNPYCELCPNRGGIFKRTDTGRWVHMVCALYTRGVTFENIVTLTGVSLFELNYALYGSKACTICEDRRLAKSGICIGCDAGLCKIFFHPTCAQKEGLLFESHTDEVDPYFAQCKQHADKSVIRKKKKTCTALFARLKRVQHIDSSDRIKRKLDELTKRPDSCLTRWTPENQPPVSLRVSRMLLTSPSLIIKLTKKSELLGLDPTSAFMTIQDEMEMARQKWHIPPAFNLEFVAYCRDRTTRMVAMKKKNLELMSQNVTLKKRESSLREQYNSYKDSISNLKSEIDNIIKQIRDTQKSISASTGKPFSLPSQLESLIDKCSSAKAKTPNNKSSKTASKTSTTYGCGKCETVKDQHLLALCDTCKCYFHIYCLDPPLTRVPKKTKFGGWQCSDCSERDEEEQEEALEEQNTLAIQEAEGPRRLRERINAPDKYCHESMMMADFWSTSKKTKKNSSKSSKLKKPKVEV